MGDEDGVTTDSESGIDEPFSSNALDLKRKEIRQKIDIDGQSLETFLYIDVKNSVALRKEESKDDIILTFNAYHDFIGKYVHGSDAHIISENGESLMIEFDTPQGACDTATSILHGMHNFNENSNRLNESLDIGIGVHSILIPNSPGAGGYVDEENEVPVKIEAAGPPNAIYITELTFTMLDDRENFEHDSFLEDQNIHVFRYNLIETDNADDEEDENDSDESSEEAIVQVYIKPILDTIEGINTVTAKPNDLIWVMIHDKPQEWIEAKIIEVTKIDDLRVEMIGEMPDGARFKHPLSKAVRICSKPERALQLSARETIKPELVYYAGEHTTKKKLDKMFITLFAGLIIISVGAVLFYLYVWN